MRDEIICQKLAEWLSANPSKAERALAQPSLLPPDIRDCAKYCSFKEQLADREEIQAFFEGRAREIPGFREEWRDLYANDPDVDHSMAELDRVSLALRRLRNCLDELRGYERDLLADLAIIEAHLGNTEP